MTYKYFLKCFSLIILHFSYEYQKNLLKELQNSLIERTGTVSQSFLFNVFIYHMYSASNLFKTYFPVDFSQLI